MTQLAEIEMTAVAIERPGPPDALVTVVRPRPEPREGEVLIRVAAAGVNRPDVLQRMGVYPPPPGASDLPGLEVAGEVVAAGRDVIWPRPGDRVCALVNGGGYAQYAVAPAPQCLPVPEGLGLSEAAALPETFFTVWANVFDRCHLQPGETFLVHGGASGIGTTAIQVCRALGARVFATAGSPEKCAACVRLGAEHAVNYRQDDFVDAIRQRTDGAGVDVILDMVGGDYTARNLRLLRPKGRLAQIFFLRGSEVNIDLADIMTKQLVVTGSTLRPRTTAEKGAIAASLRKRVWPLIESGAVRPVLHAELPLTEAAEAHRLMEADRHIGKIVLRVPRATPAAGDRGDAGRLHPVRRAHTHRRPERRAGGCRPLHPRNARRHGSDRPCRRFVRGHRSDRLRHHPPWRAAGHEPRAGGAPCAGFRGHPSWHRPASLSESSRSR